MSDDEAKTGECTIVLGNQKGRRWVVLSIGCNGLVRARDHYARQQADFRVRTKDSSYSKGSEE